MAIKTQGSFALKDVSNITPDEKHAYRIACAQVLPAENGMTGEGGLDKLEAYAKEAARNEADVVVFPEYFLTGATHDAWRAVRDPDTLGSPTHPDDDADHFLRRIGDIAKENDIDIVAGTVVETGSHHVPHRRDESDDEPTDTDPEHDQKLFNTVYYVDRTGQIAGRYTKKRLWHPERSVLSPGHELRHVAPRTFSITTRRGVQLRAGIAVCWDLAFPETFREMFDLPSGSDDDGTAPLVGPDIVFAPTCWFATDGGTNGIRWNRDGEAALLDSICTARAIENECILAMTNVAGPDFPTSTPPSSLSDEDAIGVGRTCVCAPFVGCAGRVEHAGEALLLAAVDLRMLNDARTVYKCRHDLRAAWSQEQKQATA